jgi:DNA helicase II / ATP-dependent DNA helicase PcrA
VVEVRPERPDAPDLLAGLNEAQRRAVMHDGGPLAVLAGPGTGKTRVIVHRIAHLIAARGAKPEQIVGVTFTVKAADEMRERLARLVGPSVADRVNVWTFHGLGWRLVQRHADKLGLPPEPELIDSAQRRRLLRRLMSEHNLFRDIVGRGRDTVLGTVEHHLEAFWNHAVDEWRAREFCGEWEKRIGGIVGDECEAERAKLARFRDICALAALFDGACRKRGWVSFGDLLSLPARLLRTDQRVAGTVRSDWRHIVVDEYQDANAAQIALLEQLAPPSREDVDLCVVGDDDQSIYEFRGSDDRAFEKFARLWRGCKLIELSENYRSCQGIIDAAGAVIQRAEVRFKADKKLVRASTAGAEGAGAGVVGVKLKQNREDGDVIAAMILTDRKKRPAAPWKDYAVLARGRGDVDRVAGALAIEGIPFVRRFEGGVADDPGVQDVLAWIELLVEPRATWAARRIMIRPPFGLPTEAVGKWEQAYRQRVRQRQMGDERTQDPGDYVAWLRHQTRDEAHHAGKIARLAELYEELRADAAIRRADETIFRIVTLTDPAHADLLRARERAGRVSNLVSVLRFARERQARLDEPADLATFWAYYRDLDKDERQFECDPLTRIDGEAGDGAALGDDDVDAVQLVTAHSAKGLEFDTVFVTKAAPGGFPSTKADDEELPEGLVDRAGDTRTSRERRLAEERRLFYVACTRAERRLILLAKWNKNPSGSTHFFEELAREAPKGGRPLVPAIDMDDVLRQAQEAGVGAAARGEFDLEGRGYAQLGDLRQALTRVRREARIAASAALDGADTAGATPADLDAAQAALRDAAARLAIAAQIERTRARPYWAKARPEWTDLAAALERVAQKGGEGPTEVLQLRPMAAPLQLSYTMIRNYLGCGRCFYLKQAFDLAEPDSPHLAVGLAAHQAMETFYRDWARADAEGLSKPGRDRLLALGKEAFFRAAARFPFLGDDERDKLLAQLGHAFDKLHDDRAHVLEQEQTISFDYQAAGRTHRFTARIDRIDQWPDGRVRLIDYKTGKPAEGLLTPPADDLQLGTYAMAMQSREPDMPLRGTAEYWVLSTGERGWIDLSSLDLDAVRSQIDNAVAGMLAGVYKKGKRDSGCNGLCSLLD